MFGPRPLRSSSNVVSSYYLVLNLLYWQCNISRNCPNVFATISVSPLQRLHGPTGFHLQRHLGIIIKQVEKVSGSWNPTKGAVGVEVDRRSVVVHRVLRLSKSGVA